MQNTTDIQDGQQSLSQTNVNETDKQPYSRQDIKDTPFTAIYEEGRGWYAVMGNQRVTEGYESYVDLEKYIKEKGWKLLTVVIAGIIEKIVTVRDEAIQAELKTIQSILY